MGDVRAAVHAWGGEEGLSGLPPRELNFSYPPHVEMVTDGYRLGLEWIRDHPGAFARRVAARLDIAWRGAALGWTGRGLPWGLAGERRAVDLTVPDGSGYAIWRWLLLGACLAGAWVGRRNGLLCLWLLFGAVKVVAVAAFFGYARHGATLIPLVAALAALGVADIWRRAGVSPLEPRAALKVAAVIAVLGLGIEVHRYLRPPSLVIDERAIGRRDPHPLGDHVDRRVDLTGR